jgi:hypothetical protein
MKPTCTLLLAITLFLLGTSKSSAQFDQYWRGPSNTEIGYSYCVATAEFKYRDNNFNERTGRLTDTGFTQRLTSKSGFGAYAGYYWPVAKMNDMSRLSIGLGYMYNFYLWDGEIFSYASNGSYNSRTGSTNTGASVGSGTVELALPIGVDYKYGCDALKDKSHKFCASFGAGVYPSASVTVFKDNGGFAFRARPYVRAEVGMFAGICFKVRATYILGSSNYINYEDSGPGYETSTTFKSAGTAAFTLILMPFSWKWNKAQWWGN